MFRWMRVVSFIRVTMALNPNAAPFVRGSGGAASASASTGKSTTAAAPKVYCDLDGCLVDFEKGCRAVFSGKNPNELTPKIMWGGLARTKGFCECRLHVGWLEFVAWIRESRRLKQYGGYFWRKVFVCRLRGALCAKPSTTAKCSTVVPLRHMCTASIQLHCLLSTEESRSTTCFAQESGSAMYHYRNSTVP